MHSPTTVRFVHRRPQRYVSLLPALALLPVVVMTALPLDPAEAHLSIIRQGRESTGTMEIGDKFGFALAAGDFNRDGYEDLATGSPGETVAGLTDAGAVTINWGSEFGLTHVGAVQLTAGDLGATTQAGAEFGFALTAGDFDGDGDDDLIIGAPGANAGVGTDTGEIYVLDGGAGGLSFAAYLNQANAGGSNESGDRFGAAFAVGDFNSDSYEDLVVGAPGEDSDAGAVFWFEGSMLGLPGSAGWFKQSDLGGSTEAGDHFGYALTAGNLVGTAHDDLAVGAPYEDTESGDLAVGDVWIIRGGASGLTATGAFSISGADFGGVQEDGHFGMALAAGHLKSSLYDALVVGEPDRTLGISSHAGRVYFVPGGTGGLDLAGSYDVIESDAGGKVEDGDRFGASVAVGNFWDPADGYEDLAVGAPGDGLGITYSAGQVQILNGGVGGPDSTYGWWGFNQGTCNEPWEFGDQMGCALAFGAFDGTDRGNLAVGAYGEDFEDLYPESNTVLADAGMVHVIAPWRQTYGLSARTASVEDCEGNLIFTVKPFEKIKIASTTKALTILMASERCQLPPSHPDYVDSSLVYTVPAWVANDIGGSTADLLEGEFIKLKDLMYLCLMISANDAAHAIADILGSGADHTSRVVDFVGQMNARAAAIGMNDSHFTDPNGFDGYVIGSNLGDHYSNAYDMLLLSRAAMQNSMVRVIAGTNGRTIPRWTPTTYWIHTYGNFMNGVLNNVPYANGIKGGTTDGAGETQISSARPPGFPDNAVAGWFGSPIGVKPWTMTAAILNLGTEECGYSMVIPPPLPLSFLKEFKNAKTMEDSITGGSQDLIEETAGKDVEFHLIRQVGSDDTSMDLEMARIWSATLAPGETLRCGVEPFDEHTGIRLTNMDSVAIDVQTWPSSDPDPTVYTIDPFGSVRIPDYVGSAGTSSYELEITSLERVETVHLTVEERYAFHFPVVSASVGQAFFTGRLLRAGTTPLDDMASFRLIGTDPASAGEDMVTLILATPGTPLGVTPPGDVDWGMPGPLADLGAAPNPFRERTRIQFLLGEAARVEAAVFDIAGRRIRRFPAEFLEPGPGVYTWDGVDDAGRRAAAGLYFYRLVVNGRHVATGKLVLTP